MDEESAVKSAHVCKSPLGRPPPAIVENLSVANIGFEPDVMILKPVRPSSYCQGMKKVAGCWPFEDQ